MVKGRLVIPLAAVLALGLIGSMAVLSSPLRFAFGVALPLAAMLLFLVGFVLQVLRWARAPVPFRIPTTCGQQKSLSWIKADNLEAPHDTKGVIGRMALEILLFRSLFRNTRMELHQGKTTQGATKWLWLGALAFHYCALLVVLRHLRLFVEPVPGFVATLSRVDGFFAVGSPVLYLTGVGFLAGLAYLLARRLLIPSLRYMSLAADYFALMLLLGIGASGIILRHWVKTDVVAVKEWATGLAALRLSAPAEGFHYLFWAHLCLVCTLLVYFPWSKLMHAGGVFLSPTRNLATNSRAFRHVNPWNPEVKVHTYAEYEDEFRQKMTAAGIPVEKAS